jgi:hypothetical protein
MSPIRAIGWSVAIIIGSLAIGCVSVALTVAWGVLAAMGR